MRVLIVGAAGFIGSSLYHFLDKDGGHEIYTTDVYDFTKCKRHFILDCSDLQMETLFAEFEPELVINASGSGNVQASFTDPDLDRKLNLDNVESLLKALLRANIRPKFINLSSAAVYGAPTSLPISESQAEGALPLSPYGKHKQLSEILLSEYFDLYHIPGVNFRVFSCFGPGQRKLLLWDIYQKLEASGFKRIELFGTGSETRDFIHVYDLFRALMLFVEKGEFNGTSINVASGVQTKISDLVSMATRAIGCEPQVSFNGKSRPGDPKFWQADISRLNSLGFVPSVELENGIAEYYAWIKSL